MNTIDFIKIYLVAVAAFFAIDMLWLGLVARAFYFKHLGFLLRNPPNWYAAISFYLLFVAGLVVFAVVPGIQAGSLRKALLLGALYGLCTYATYDLTNQAVIKNWPLLVTAVDMTWGVVLAASVSLVAYLGGNWLR